MMWRYREARSWRAVLIDVGHAVMFYRHVALRLGYNLYTYQKFDDKLIGCILGVDIIKQSPLYVGTII
jgi:hypothetical protein